MDDWYQHIQKIIFPNQCVLCRAHCGCLRDLCLGCERDLAWLPQKVCYQCAMPLLHSQMRADVFVCGQCLKHPPPFQQTIALCHYHSPIDKLISQLKFNNDLVMAKIIGSLMVDHIERRISQGYQLPDLIIPMPLHRKRLHDRGFNQALEITRPIAKRFALPIAISACVRTKATQAQSELSSRARRQNVHAAFAVTDAGKQVIADKHIVVVDDVMTTGTTMRECCRAISRAKPKRIDVWCFARTGG